MDEDEKFCIANWCPPWVDNGRALLEMVTGLQEMDDVVCWKIMSSLLAGQLKVDLEVGKAMWN